MVFGFKREVSMLRKIWLLSFAAVLGLGLWAQPTQALILIDWNMDFEGVDGLTSPCPDPGGGAGDCYLYENIEELGFNVAINHAEISDTDGSGTVSVGDLGTVEGIGSISGIFGGGVLVPTGADGKQPLNVSFVSVAALDDLEGFEIEFSFDVDIIITAVDATTADFTHLGPNATAGLLELRVDNLSDGGLCDPSSQDSVNTCSNGVVIARFIILPGEGGDYQFDLDAGQDNATFQAIFLLTGVWSDTSGTDLACGTLASTLATTDCGLLFGLTDGNFDAPEGIGSVFGAFGCTEGIGGNQSVTDFCVEADGSFQLAISEPGTIALFGIGLLGLAWFGRRRRRVAS
jgi:hypothetical protein